jgi:hypothetical protein
VVRVGVSVFESTAGANTNVYLICSVIHMEETNYLIPGIFVFFKQVRNPTSYCSGSPRLLTIRLLEGPGLPSSGYCLSQILLAYFLSK